MPDNNGGTGLDLLTKATNDIAREIGEMDPDDPLRPERVKDHAASSPPTPEVDTTKWWRSKEANYDEKNRIAVGSDPLCFYCNVGGLQR